MDSNRIIDKAGNSLKIIDKTRRAFLRFTVIYYTCMALGIYFQYMFTDYMTTIKVASFLITCIAVLMQIGAFFTLKKENSFEIFSVVVGAVFFTGANLVLPGSEVMFLFIPFCILSMLISNKDINNVLHIVWIGNAIIRLVILVFKDSTTMKQYKDFVWILFICFMCMGTVDLVYKVIGVYYSKVILNLFSESKKHQELYEQSKVDSTTELLNRNAYNEYLEAFDTDIQSVCCIYIDVNGLHEYNNAFGHHAGDEMLSTVAEEMKKCFRSSRQYRVGGDEFVIICENASFKEVLTELKAFRVQMKEHKIHVATGMEWRDENISIEEIVKAADTKMYQDKEQFYKNHSDERTATNLYAKKIQ